METPQRRQTVPVRIRQVTVGGGHQVVVQSMTNTDTANAQATAEQVAERINRFPEVNHNYLREHRYNLWFVLTGPDRTHLDRVLAEIEADTGLVPLDLPMQSAYRIDLGFPLGDLP